MLGFDSSIDIDRIINSIKNCKLPHAKELEILKQFKIDFAGHSDFEIKKALNKRINRLSRKNLPWTPDKQSKGYRDGYETGFKWRSNYIPGGPYIFHTSNKNDLKFLELELESIENHKNYMAGFKAGLKLNRSSKVSHLK